MTYHYLIEVHKVGIKEQILCTENQIKLLEKKQRAKKAA
jgi:hypothetical protein